MPLTRIAALCSALALLPLVASPVSAQATVAETDAEARGVFQAGRAAYDAGRYEEALGYFRRAYELSGRTQLLYNVGQAADRLRMDEEALEAFKRYLAETPEPSNREEVETRIQILERVVADKRASGQVPGPAEVAALAPAAQPTADGSARSADTEGGPITSKWWFWTGAGVIVTGIVIGVVIAVAGGDDAVGVTKGTDGSVIEALSAAR